MRKRMTSLLLTLVMLLSLVPAMGVTASAAELTTVNSYEELQTAVKAKKEYIQLGRNIDTKDFHYSGGGLDIADWLTFENQTCTLDLNGKTLSLLTRMGDMPTFMRVYEGSNLTIKDSQGGGQITGEFENTGAGDRYLIHMNKSSLTLEGGTFRATAKPYGTNVNVIDYLESNVTIKDGVTISQPEHYAYGGGGSALKGHGYALCEQEREFNYGDKVSHVVIDGGIFDGWVRLIGYPDTNGSVQINGGTFKKGVQALYVAKKNNSDPTVTVNGGTFEDNVYLQDWDWKESLYMPYRLNGGTFKGTVDLHAVNNITVYQKPESNPNVALGLNECFGYSAVVTPDGTFAGPDAKTGVLKKTGDYDYDMWLEGTASNPVRIIPNAWGMKSVTLDGTKKINYAKDWTGEWKRVNNDQDHTLVFEWSLSDDMKKAGYTYDAKYLLYRTNSSDEPTPIPVDTSKNTLELKINKGTSPGGYSYDLRLDLKKGGVDLSSSPNQHIVMLVVDPAQEIDTRTPIDSVTLNVPKLKEGDKSGGNFTLSGANTGVNSTVTTVWEGIPTTGAVAGNFYAARITLTAKDGYAFNTSTQVKLNGDYLSKGSGIDNGGAGMTVYVNVPVRHEHTFSGDWQNLNNDKEYHFKTCSCGAQEKEPHNLKYDESLDKYTCTCGYWIEGTKEKIQFVAASPRSPIDGESPSNYTPEQWVHNIGKNYTVASIDWKDEAGHAVTTFESGKIYKGTVTFKADDGFKFDKDRIQFDRIFDTSTTETVEGYNLDEGAITLIATFKLKDNTVVRPGLQVKVKLPSLNDKIGQSFPEAELVNTTLPDDVELTTSVYENIFDAPITGSVAPNKTYFYAVWLKLGNNDSVEAITKKYNVSYTVTDGGDAEYHTDNVAGYGVLARYQTPDASATSKISSVALTVTAPKYGEAPATTATGANNTLYTVGEPTWSPAVTDGKFGAAAYTVSIPVTVQSGYSFDTNCVYTVNGYVATYADDKVSYTFPALTAPHTHDYTGQPWQYLNPGNHYQECTASDGYNIQAHEFSAWTKVDNTNHSRTCSKCKMTDGSTYTETAEHTWVWVVDQEAALNQPGKQHEECTDCHAKRSENTEIPALTAISAVNVTVTAPVKGATPENAMTVAGSPYSVAATDWDPPTVSSTFAGGTKYTVKVSLEATGNNRFTDTTTFQINGKAATIVTKNGEEAVITLTFDATEGTPAATEYTVKFDGNGGTSSVSTMKTTDKKLASPLPTATRSGSYSFDGWYTEKNGGTKITTSTVFDKDTTVYAHWTYTGSTGGGGGGVTTYPITVKSAKNGDVTASHKSTSKGTTVTLTVDPDKGYVLDTLTVLDGKDKELKLTEKNGKYTFTMPASKVTVEATFKASAPTGKNPFIDVPAGSYYEDAVIWAVDKGITTGTSATTFNPNGICTRAQAVTFLWRAAGSPAPKTKVMPFADVKAGSYYYDAVLWAVEQGITKGTSDTMFSPDATCTRAQIVTFLWRANGSPAVSGNSAFTDVAADAYYAAAVTWAEKNDVTGGIGGGLFGSNNNCTRAQIVTFLYRAMK